MKIIKNIGGKKLKSPVRFGKMFADLQSERKGAETKQYYTHAYAVKSSVAQEGVGSLFDSINSEAARRYTMIISTQHKQVQSIDLDPEKSEVIIGTHALADVTLKGDGIADFHAKVISSNGSLALADLNSSSGIFLNGQRLPVGSSMEVNENSEVKIQHYYINFELHSPPSQQSITQKVKHIGPEQQLQTEDCLLSHLIHNRKYLNSWAADVTELSVVEIIAETADVKTFRLASKQPLVFHYQPGQFVTLIVRIDGTEVRRSFSITSSPSRPHIIELTVKRVDKGLVSNWLCDEIKAGDTLKIKGPSGNFSCFNYPSKKILFLAAGSGIAPIMSMLRWITDSGAEVDIRLLMSFSKPDDVIYGKELALLGKRHKNLKIGLTLTSQEIGKEHWQGHVGRINRSFINKFAPDLSEREVFLCGPESFMKTAKEILLGLDLSVDNLHTESFSHNDLRVEPKLTAQTIRNTNGKYKVTFAKSGLTVPANGKVNLLDLASAYDQQIDSDCRNGNCGECMIKCLAGKIEMLEDAEMDARDKASGWIYSCCTYPRSDIVLDA